LYGFCCNRNPDVVETNTREIINGVPTEVYQVKYKETILRKHIEVTVHGKRIRNLISSPDELEMLLSIPYVPLSADFTKYAVEKEELGERGLMMMDLGDPLCPLFNMVSAEYFAVWTLTDYYKMLAFTDVMYQRLYDLYKMYLENDIGDVFFLVGTEFAGPPLVSPDKFNQLSVRYVKGIVDLIGSYGKHSIVHYHGNLYHVLDGMKEINPDGLHTIEAPPIGDCTITQARERLGDMILIGNIQYDDIRRLDTREIDAMVYDAINEGKTGRFILSPTAGPYEDSIPQCMVDNYIAFITAGVKYGGYS
jgi:hypothetical protein